jgi:hypothetical protein
VGLTKTTSLKKLTQMSEQPLMEHPTGEYENAIEAMTAALQRLRSLPEWNRWITFCAQGEGDSPESTRFAEVRILSDIVDAGVAVNVAQLTNQAKVERRTLTEAGGNRYSIANATPHEAAQLLDALFRYVLGVRPFPDEDDDYAVGAEW